MYNETITFLDGRKSHADCHLLPRRSEECSENNHASQTGSQCDFDLPGKAFAGTAAGFQYLGTETGREALAREVYEELGLRIPKEDFRKLAVYDDPGRIAAYQDGSVWRMVIVVYGLDFPQEPTLRISAESRELRFFSREELSQIEIAVTHEDIIQDWFVKDSSHK